MPANLNKILARLALGQLCLLSGCDVASLIAISDPSPAAPVEAASSSESVAPRSSCRKSKRRPAMPTRSRSYWGLAATASCG